MFAYCLNNPVNGCDPDGLSKRRLTMDCLYGGIGGAGVVLIPIGIGFVNFGQKLVELTSDTIQGIFSFFANFKRISSYRLGNSILEQNLSDIASSHGLFKCKEAAESMAEYLKKHGKHAEMVTITFVGGPGFIWSNSTNEVISQNGVHVGILYNGLVFCNVHPLGLPEISWISDFEGLGAKVVIKTPI